MLTPLRVKPILDEFQVLLRHWGNDVILRLGVDGFGAGT
jgi:hypothetical protein